MILALALALLAAPALAQETPAPAQQAPQVSLTLAPQSPVTVGTPLRVTATVLVPSYMPKPPVWPDLQIADAVTRLPERATHPVTRRIGTESWSGLARTWEIIPQRPADYDLGEAEVTVTYADPGTNAPTEAQLTLPEIAFSAALPLGAEGMDPFLAATALTLTATLDDLRAAQKPGDAFTLNLTVTAEGPPAMLLPPLADRLPTPDGLRAYPRQPALTDGLTATRTEAVTYVIERPGAYAFPALTFDWWNLATNARETAATPPLTVEVPAPPGWRPPQPAGAPRTARWILLALAGLAAAAALATFARRPPRPPSEPALHRALRRATRRSPPAEIRARLAAWRAALPEPAAPQLAIESALRRLERPLYLPGAAPDPGARRALRIAIKAARPYPSQPAGLPGLNPPRLDTRNNPPL